MKKLVILPLIALLGGCAGLAFPTSDQIRSDLNAARSVACFIAGPSGGWVQADSAFACQLLGGTAPTR